MTAKPYLFLSARREVAVTSRACGAAHLSNLLLHATASGAGNEIVVESS